MIDGMERRERSERGAGERVERVARDERDSEGRYDRRERRERVQRDQWRDRDERGDRDERKRRSVREADRNTEWAGRERERGGARDYWNRKERERIEKRRSQEASDQASSSADSSGRRDGVWSQMRIPARFQPSAWRERPDVDAGRGSQYLTSKPALEWPQRKHEATERGAAEPRDRAQETLQYLPSRGTADPGQTGPAGRWRAAVVGSGRGEALFPDNEAFAMRDRQEDQVNRPARGDSEREHGSENSVGSERWRAAVVGSGKGERLFPDNQGLNLNDRVETATSPSSLSPTRAVGPLAASGRGERLFPDSAGLNLNDRVEVVPSVPSTLSLQTARQGQGQLRIKHLQRLEQQDQQQQEQLQMPVMTVGELKRERDGTAFPPTPPETQARVVPPGTAIAAKQEMPTPQMSASALQEYKSLSKLQEQAAALGYSLAPATKEVESLKDRGRFAGCSIVPCYFG
jgi:hypothetical protein